MPMFYVYGAVVFRLTDEERWGVGGKGGVGERQSVLRCRDGWHRKEEDILRWMEGNADRILPMYQTANNRIDSFRS